MKKRNQEHDEQVTLFKGVELMKQKYPELRLMYAIPNAARRSPRQGAWMKAEGLRAGVPDIHLPVGRNGFSGLWLEMKIGKNRLTPAQAEYIGLLREEGHLVEVCYSWSEAMFVVETYLKGAGIEAYPA